MNKENIDKQQDPAFLASAVSRSCIHCGNKKDFKVWTELEYDDGSGEPTTGNHLIDVEFVECLKCGEIL